METCRGKEAARYAASLSLRWARSACLVVGIRTQKKEIYASIESQFSNLDSGVISELSSSAKRRDLFRHVKMTNKTRRDATRLVATVRPTLNASGPQDGASSLTDAECCGASRTVGFLASSSFISGISFPSKFAVNEVLSVGFLIEDSVYPILLPKPESAVFTSVLRIADFVVWMWGLFVFVVCFWGFFEYSAKSLGPTVFGVNFVGFVGYFVL